MPGIILWQDGIIGGHKVRSCGLTVKNTPVSSSGLPASYRGLLVPDPRSTHHFIATVTVSPSPTFYRWVFGWNGAMKILDPENVKDEYRAMVRKALED